jgi:hypothetical protein
MLLIRSENPLRAHPRGIHGRLSSEDQRVVQEAAEGATEEGRDHRDPEVVSWDFVLACGLGVWETGGLVTSCAPDIAAVADPICGCLLAEAWGKICASRERTSEQSRPEISSQINSVARLPS